MIRNLIAFLTLSAALCLVVACGNDDGAEMTPSPADTPDAATQTETLEPTTPARTETTKPTGTVRRELADVLAMPGFQEFSAEFEAAVQADDVEFFVNHAHFEDYAYCYEESQPTPMFGYCEGIVEAPPEILMTLGAWQSEGGWMTPPEYEGLFEQSLATEGETDAYMYALGMQVRGPGEHESGVDIVIGGTGTAMTVDPFELALSVRADMIDGEWIIVSVDRAITNLVPDFYEWWVPWDEAFPDD